MSIVVFFVVGTLTGYKVIPETQTKAPFEWAGELLAMIVMIIFALAAVAYVEIVGDFEPWTVPDFAPSMAEIRYPNGRTNDWFPAI